MKIQIQIRPILLAALLLAGSAAIAAPKVVVISLDGATPRLVENYLGTGALPSNTGLGLLKSKGIRAKLNQTVSPSLTAPGHIAIVTGSTAAANDVVANGFHLLASPFTSNISGFGAPIGGYSITGPAPSPTVTAVPLWSAVRAQGMKVAVATFPGADGIDVTVPGLVGSPVIQPALERTVDYTVPFGAFAGQGAKGFSLTAADFTSAPALTIDQLTAAGRPSFSPVLEKTTDLDTFNITGGSYRIRVATLDTTDDGVVNYDTLVFFNFNNGIQPGPFSLPSTGPAYVKASDRRSAPFYLEGSAAKAGTGFYVSKLAPDLSTVRIARYSANSIPRFSPVPAVIENVDDINTHVGFWAPQPDFRIPERLSPGFAPFPDDELEAIYADLVDTFVDYQTRVALRALERTPDADLLMTYIEQPDGSEHQFLLTDLRQPTDFLNPASIGGGQDPAKVARYAQYVTRAYQVANNAVQRIIDAVGTDAHGKPKSNILVVSDHGFETFHTAVNMNQVLRDAGFDLTKVRAVTSGPAANIYISLQGREPNGTVSRAEFVTLQQQVVNALVAAGDTNATYTLGAARVPLFAKIYARPLPVDLNDPEFGRDSDAFIGQDSGDVYALLTPGYNFDGTQNPVVQRLGDAPVVAPAVPVLSLPNFYGAHGYDPELPSMSAIFYAAGPDIRTGKLEKMRNIDIAPTVLSLLGVEPAPTVQGRRLPIGDARKMKSQALADLTGLLPGSDPKRLRAAIQNLQQSLNPQLWADEAHLTPKGKRVFDEERKAVQELGKIRNPIPQIASAIETLVEVDAELAEIAILEASESCREPSRLNDARRQFAEGEEFASTGQPEKAIAAYRAAWSDAQKAMRKHVED